MDFGVGKGFKSGNWDWERAVDRLTLSGRPPKPRGPNYP